MLKKLRFWKTKTQTARDAKLKGTHSSPPLPLSKTATPSQAPDQEVCQSNIEIEGMDSSPPLPLSITVTPSQALDREASQFNVKTQPAQFVNPERQKIRAENLRIRTGRFRILIIGRANAGKTTILQRVCNTTEQPKIFDPQGHEVCAIHITLCH